MPIHAYSTKILSKFGINCSLWLALIIQGVISLTDLTGSYGGIMIGNSGKSSQYHSVGEPPQWITEPPLKATFSNSSGLRLECVATGEPPPVVEWYQEDQLITHNLHGLRAVMQNGTLVFPQFSSEQFREDVHIASYHCRARNRLGTIISRPVKVKGVVDQDYTVSVQDAIVIQGNTAILRCDVPSSVREHVTVTSWLHEEGTAIEITLEREPRGKYTLLQSGDLLIHHTSTYDTYKKYVCKTQHKLANIRRRNIKPARLILSDPNGTILPKLVEPSDPHQKVERKMLTGDHILMPCVSHGYPVPESTWFRVDGVGLRQVLPSPRFKFHLEVLAIHDLQVDDSGIYVCIMNNTVGAERIEVNLTVRNPLSVRVEPPRQTIDLNHPAAFRCFYAGWPVDRVEWLKNGQPFQTGNRYVSSTNGTLKLLTVQEGDEGVYQCVVANGEDTAQATAYLWLGDSKPSLLYRFSEQTLQPGPSVSLKCIAKGNPPPRISWHLDGFPLPQIDRYVVGHYVTIHDDVISHVNISRVESKDGGSYSCTATNTVGSVSHIARLNIYENGCLFV